MVLLVCFPDGEQPKVRFSLCKRPSSRVLHSSLPCDQEEITASQHFNQYLLPCQLVLSSGKEMLLPCLVTTAPFSKSIL